MLIAVVFLGADQRGAGAAEGPPSVSCEACIVVDGEGRTLWARAAHASLPNASTTKMVTALVVRDETQLDEHVIVSEVAGNTGGGGLDLLAGDDYTVEALLYALLLSSSNDAAVALAEHVSGSEAVFVDEMNRRLERLGAEDTTFVTAHGLDAPGHAASAADLADIGEEVLEDDVLAEIVATPEITISGSRGPQLLDNSNPLIEGYKGAVGIKTGMTSLAGEVLVAAARRRGDLVIAVAMRSFDAGADARALLDFGFQRLGDEVALRAGTLVRELVLDPGGSVSIVTSEPIEVLPPRGGVERRVRMDASLGSTLRQGEQVGVLELVSDDKVVASAPLEVADPIERPEASVVQSIVEALLSFVYAAGRTIGVA